VTVRVKCEKELQNFSVQTKWFSQLVLRQQRVSPTTWCGTWFIISLSTVFYVGPDTEHLNISWHCSISSPKRRSCAHSTVQFLEAVRIFVLYFSFISCFISVLVLYKKGLFFKLCKWTL